MSIEELAKLRELGNIPFGLHLLEDIYPDTQAIEAKSARLENSGEFIRLKRGLYVVSPKVSEKPLNEFLIANHLYGPSYVSRQSALRYYGLIPERVNEITSMTTGQPKFFTNKIASFSYLHCSPEYFGTGVDLEENNGINYLIASPEKALCDLMIYTPHLNLRFIKEVRTYLEEDLRFDISALPSFNIDLLREIRDKGKKKNMISQLIKYIENERSV